MGLTLRAKFKAYVSVVRCLSYWIDVSSDIYVAIDIYQNGPFLLFILAAVFIAIPVLLTAIESISNVIQDIERTIITKLVLITAIILFAPAIPSYILVTTSYHLVRGGDPEAPIVARARRVKILEALLEAFPQAAFQMALIVFNDSVAHWWQYLSLTSSIITLSLTIATSDYISENADIPTRLVFFVFNIITVTARLMICMDLGIPAVTLLVPAIIIWLVKRCSPGCCCSCLHLAPIHHHLSTCYHPVISWALASFANSYTNTGLVMGTITLAWTALAWLFDPWQVEDITYLVWLQQDPAFTTWLILLTTFSLMSFLSNVVFVTVPRFRRSIGDMWLNKNPDNQTTQY